MVLRPHTTENKKSPPMTGLSPLVPYLVIRPIAIVQVPCCDEAMYLLHTGIGVISKYVWDKQEKYSHNTSIQL